MALSDLTEDGSYQTPIKGEGYSVSHDGKRTRFDAWRENEWHSVPFMGWPPTATQTAAALRRLRDDGMAEQVDALEAALVANPL